MREIPALAVRDGVAACIPGQMPSDLYFDALGESEEQGRFLRDLYLCKIREAEATSKNIGN